MFRLSSALLFLVPLTVFAAPEVKPIQPDENAGSSAAVIVGPATLAHTAQVMGKGKPAEQVEGVLDQLDATLKGVGSGLDQAVKLNVYVTKADTVAEVRKALAKWFRGKTPPAVSFVAGATAKPDAIVAMDAVAVADDVKAVKLSPGAALLPAGSRVYIAGQAEKGAGPVEATRKTLESLRATLKWLNLDDSQVVQVKVFMTPMTAAEEVLKEIGEFYAKGKTPSVALVEWKSSLPVEIELVAASPSARPKLADVVEYLTPPGMTASPVYARVTRVHSDRTIYLSGLYSAEPGKANEQVEDVFASLGKLLDKSGSDFRHLAKATYYVSDDDASRVLNEVRPRFYDPRRPPAASKAMVPGVAMEGRSITLDMIAVPSLLVMEGKPEHGFGLTAEEAADGWLSLFDGKTTFGWEGAKVDGNALVGGRTTTALGNCEVKGEFERGGMIVLGGKEIEGKTGAFTLAETKGRGPIKLGNDVAVRKLAVRPLGMKSIMPGKDLDGWKRIDRPTIPAEKRPVWKVAGGKLGIVGGPGALEYPEKHGDVVITISARSRNRHANGGLFFRSIPGDFMNGYEAQVHSRSVDGDPAKPFTYATGGIDDRQNARRLVSRDFEWFTMTVIANGPHIATWVNGYQVTDWTDTRAKDDNPRKGLRLESGTIQLQAHDPETDLEFRRVEVGALK